MKRWTPRLAVSRSRRKLQTAMKPLAAVAHEWQDVDQGIVDSADELIRELEQFADEIRDSIEDRLAAGENVGI